MKERLDVILVQEGYAASREKAKAIIMAGDVFVDGQREDKAGTTFELSKIRLEVRGNTLPFVSRGGLKLDKAVKKFGFSLQDRICMDIGASTGGFTDCMLQNGAEYVYAVDVGSDQLAQSLREDRRVCNMEKTDIRNVTNDSIIGKMDFVSVDVSFISLKLVLPKVYELLNDGKMAAVLVKPQFEAGKSNIGKHGIVKSPTVHAEVLEDIINFSKLLGFGIYALDYSPIKGGKGNIEYLLMLSKDAEENEFNIKVTVRDAFVSLKNGGK